MQHHPIPNHAVPCISHSSHVRGKGKNDIFPGQRACVGSPFTYKHATYIASRRCWALRESWPKSTLFSCYICHKVRTKAADGMYSSINYRQWCPFCWSLSSAASAAAIAQEIIVALSFACTICLNVKNPRVDTLQQPSWSLY